MSVEPDAADIALEHLLVVQRHESEPDGPFPPSGLPCPHWCQEPHGHPFDTLSLHPTDASGDAPARFHAKTLHCAEEGAVVGVVAVEALLPDRLVRSPVRVSLETDGGCTLTPGEARQAAQQLLGAAARTERLQLSTPRSSDT